MVNRCGAFFAAALILSVGLFGSAGVSAEQEPGAAPELPAADTGISGADYSLYLEEHAVASPASQRVQVPLASAAAERADFVLEGGSALWKDGKGTVTFSFTVEEAALYNVEIVWKALDSGLNPVIGVEIDGQAPYSALSGIEMPRVWKNVSEEPNKDARGNEYAPEQIEADVFQTELLRDRTGVVAEPYLVYLSAGEHQLKLVAPQQAIEIGGIAFCPPEKCAPYAGPEGGITALDTEVIVIQGEAASRKSSKSLIPKSDNSDAGMTPVDSAAQKINYIGGTAWQSPGDSLTWDFQVEQAGYYRLSMRYKQSDLINGSSLRWLKIDGKTPFEEAKTLRFPYGTGWEYYDFAGGEGEPYYIWLDAGPHTLSLEATIGGWAEFVSRLEAIAEVLGDQYIDIIKITSETPDPNADYELFNQIPDLTEALTGCRDKLAVLAADMKDFGDGGSTQCIAALENMARVLTNMLDRPYIAQQYLNDYYTNYASVSSWLYDMTDMPLSLDEIQLIPAGGERIDKSVGFFRQMVYGLKKLVVSFFGDYRSPAAQNEGETLRLWVNWGVDQVAALNAIIQDSFTAETGISVQTEIVNASLVNGILSGNYPDVALRMVRAEPVNLGMRGALADLRQFGDLDEVLTRFQEGAEIPYKYGGELYALPDSQTFYLMFYRTDILENLGIEPPETWKEFIDAAVIIQRNNLSVYVPYTQIAGVATVNTGIGALNLFPTLMAQNGLSLYNESRTATALLSDEAVGVFDFWTDLYTDYSFLEEADFYNRFRVGTMPLGIADLTTYMTIYAAAPEIRGRWAVATVPGTERPDGTIDKTTAGAGTGCAIIEKSSHKEAAWEFLKWWTSAPVQLRYNNTVESLLGVVGRTPSATVEAFHSYDWNREDLAVLEEQRGYIEEVPEVPGSYYLTRIVDQAYWAVVNGESNSRDALTRWSAVADTEIQRKIKEYSGKEC